MKRILVIGDVMLDVWSTVEFSKSSPEDPSVKVYKQIKSERTLGGAANVARQLKALSDYEELGWQVDLLGMTGMDSAGDKLRKMLLEAGIRWVGGNSPNYITTVKERLLEGSKQVLRIDSEQTIISKEDTEQLNIILEHILFKLEPYDVIVISDYAKGMITPFIMNIVKQQKTPIFVDPKLVNMSLYHDVYLLKLNKNDLECLWGKKELFFPEIEEATLSMYGKYTPHRIVVTLAGGGSITYGVNWNGELKSNTYHSEYIQKPYVCGAGDVFLSVLVYCFLQNLDEQYACNIATQTATEFCKSISTVIPNVRRDYIPD